jgi:hypothetical protein
MEMHHVLTIPINIRGVLVKHRARRSGTYVATTTNNDTLPPESRRCHSDDAETRQREVLCSFAQAAQRTFPLL